MTKASAGDPATQPEGRFPLLFFGFGLVIGLYAMLPAFTGPQLHVQRITEVVDHVIPGLIVLTVVTSGILLAGRPAGVMLAFGGLVTLAGLWMVDTHLGLIRQAVNHEVDLVAAGFHGSTALAVFLFGLAFVWRYRDMLTSSRA